MTKEKLSKRDQATEIIQLLREGRSDEALRLFEKYGFRKEFIGFVIKSGINKEDARDLVQDFTIDKLTMKSDSIKDIEFARTWMYQVLRNMVNDKGRVLKKNREVPFDEDRDQYQAPKILEENQTRSGCVQEQLAKLRETDPKRAEVIDYIMLDKKTEEIRLLIRRNYGATREFMSQCRKKFKSLLKNCIEIEE
tara:strand:+ start:271 stop:852 length:582 start_codon:yes stop_codon:yes gene_type:complete